MIWHAHILLNKQFNLMSYDFHGSWVRSYSLSCMMSYMLVGFSINFWHALFYTQNRFDSTEQDEVTGTNAPLYYQGFGNEEFNIHRCVQNYVALGVPRDRISEFVVVVSVLFRLLCYLECIFSSLFCTVSSHPKDIGLPFYGRSFKFATALNQNHGGNDLANWPDDEGEY